MSEWFSPQQLAGMPGLGSTVRAVQLRAKREGWTSQRRVGTKAMEYHVSALPKETRAALLNAALGEVATKVVRQETQLALVETNRQQLVADARQGVLHALDLMMARTGYSRKRSITLMLDMARLGQVEPQLLAMLKMARDPRGRPSADGLPSVRSLERFLDQAERGALVPKVRRPDMSVPDWAPAFMTIYQGPEKRSARAAHALLEKHWQGQMPSLDQVYAFLRKVGIHLGRQRRAAENVWHPYQRGRPGRRPGLPGPVAQDHERGVCPAVLHHRRVQRLRPDPGRLPALQPPRAVRVRPGGGRALPVGAGSRPAVRFRSAPGDCRSARLVADRGGPAPV